MPKFIPIFPLKLAVFPLQTLNLHVFEPRYRQLMNECFETGKTFAIPPVLGDRLNGYATEMRLTEISKTYESGEMDVRTKGFKVLKVLEVIQEVPDKLYSAAIVEEESFMPLDAIELNPQLYELIMKLHKFLGTDFDPYKKFENPLSYDLITYCALSLTDQCHLLEILSERQRQLTLIQHLIKIIPTIEDSMQLREKIKMNGHFRNETPPDKFNFNR
ncbi:MAG: LON peptidase substrate-binding domain-containing protein [Chitinophagales bacterium]|nr:LON peptidase substrate-binding domain-containing protein [Chitinophagales bacterium]